MPPSDSLYDRLGGEPAVTALIDTFYDRIMADDDLRPFFEHSTMETLRKMQREFIAAALGGPIVYAGRSIREAHAGRGITKKHLAGFIDHLMESLKVHDISDQDSYEIISHLNKYADEVTGDTNIDG